MNKLLVLTNLELKRNSRFYLVYLGIISSIILGLNIIQINRFRNRLDASDEIYIFEKIKDSFDGLFYGIGIIYNNFLLESIVLFSILGIFVYAVYTWIREYSKNCIYTLKMIPADKFNIYLSKMISTVVMIYGVLISQVIVLFISKNIFNIMFKNLGIVRTSLFEDIYYNPNLVKYIPVNLIEFIMNYTVNLITIISIVFTMIVIIISFKNNILSMIAGVSIYTIGGYITDRYLIGNISMYLDERIYVIGVDLIFNVLTIMILNFISYKLINKKLYI